MPPNLIPRWHLARTTKQITISALRPNTSSRFISTSLPLTSHHSHHSPQQVITDLAHLIPKPPPKKWITDLPARVGKCIIFGCSPAQIQESSLILKALAEEWRGLLAGSEGFLTGGRRGLDGREVAWGEMDSFVSSFFLFLLIFLRVMGEWRGLGG